MLALIILFPLFFLFFYVVSKLTSFISSHFLIELQYKVYWDAEITVLATTDHKLYNCIKIVLLLRQLALLRNTAH